MNHEVPFDLELDDQKKLVLKRSGQDEVRDVRIRRVFPWTKPQRYVSVRSSEGKELMLIEDTSNLNESLQKLIGEYLAGTVFIPKITHIDEIDVRFGYQQWKVQTDRGPVAFRVQEREDIRFLPDGRFNVRDADGSVYEMPALDVLDEHSRKQLESLV